MPDQPDEAFRALEARALTWLGRREYTRAELARKLAGALRKADRAAAAPASGRSGWRGGRPGREAVLADEFAPPPGLAGDAGEDPGDDVDVDSDEASGDVLPAPSDVHARAALIERVLEHLAGQGLLSDARAAEAIVHAHGRQRGLMRVAHEMQQKGVPAEIASAALAGLREQQLPAAREVWRKRFGVLPASAADRARQARFLAARGFSYDIIRNVLGGDED